MNKQFSKKKIVTCLFLMCSTLLIVSPMHTLALEPEEVHVTIRITDFDTLVKDKDALSAGDVYFKIIHDTGTEISGTATNDYEDEGDYDLSNTDFDGNGYYDELYWNIDLDTGDLTWTIEVWDADAGADDLLFKGTLTIKDPGTTGSHSDDYVFAERTSVMRDGEWVPTGMDTVTDYLSFRWNDGAEKETPTHKTSNGLIMWISLYYLA